MSFMIHVITYNFFKSFLIDHSDECMSNIDNASNYTEYIKL